MKRHFNLAGFKAVRHKDQFHPCKNKTKQFLTVTIVSLTGKIGVAIAGAAAAAADLIRTKEDKQTDDSILKKKSTEIVRWERERRKKEDQLWRNNNGMRLSLIITFAKTDPQLLFVVCQSSIFSTCCLALKSISLNCEEWPRFYLDNFSLVFVMAYTNNCLRTFHIFWTAKTHSCYQLLCPFVRHFDFIFLVVRQILKW